MFKSKNDMSVYESFKSLPAQKREVISLCLCRLLQKAMCKYGKGIEEAGVIPLMVDSILKPSEEQNKKHRLFGKKDSSKEGANAPLTKDENYLLFDLYVLFIGFCEDAYIDSYVSSKSIHDKSGNRYRQLTKEIFAKY